MNDARITVGSYTHAGKRGTQPHYFCAVCGYDTDSEETIRRHVTRNHPEIPADPSAPEPEEPKTPDDGLDDKTVNELREQAMEIGITVGDMRKQELVDAIRTTQGMTD